MHRKLLAVTALVLSLFLVSATSFFMIPTHQVVQAQNESAVPTNPCAENPRSRDCYQQNRTAYESAIKNCVNPSLECLVYYTTNYAAIEWLDNILGQKSPNPGCIPGAPGCPEASTGIGPAMASKDSAVGGLGYLIGEMYSTPVAQTGPYIADMMESMRLAPPAYAQGLGFAALNPVLNLWKIFRNLAYVFFVLVMIAIGFLIMLRKKVGQAAITAQQAIPSIIVSMLTVTFSYAIAGFLIDLMYISMFMIVGLFESTTGFQDNIINFDIFTLMWTLYIGAGNLDANRNIVETFVGSAGVDSAAAQNVLGFLGGLTLSLVIAIAILIGTFKLFFELLRAYATVVLSVVTAPITLMMGAIPGNNAFNTWIKKIIGNLLPFPTVLLVAVMFYFFTKGGVTGEGGFMPPFLLGRGQSTTITSLMGFAIILALPEIVKHVRETVGGKGGIGDMIAGWGFAAAKEAWNHPKVGVKGLQFARTAGDLAMRPVTGIAGAGLGAYYGGRYADEAGMGRLGKIAAIGAGGTVGGGIGLRGPKLIGNVIKSTGKQARDTIIKLKTEDFQTDIQAAFDRDEVKREENVARAYERSKKTGVPRPSKKTTLRTKRLI